MVWVVWEDQPVSAIVTGVVSDGTGESRAYASLPALLRASPSVLAPDDPVRVQAHHPEAGEDELVKACYGCRH